MSLKAAPGRTAARDDARPARPRSGTAAAVGPPVRNFARSAPSRGEHVERVAPAGRAGISTAAGSGEVEGVEGEPRATAAERAVGGQGDLEPDELRPGRRRAGPRAPRRASTSPVSATSDEVERLGRRVGVEGVEHLAEPRDRGQERADDDAVPRRGAARGARRPPRRRARRPAGRPRRRRRGRRAGAARPRRARRARRASGLTRRRTLADRALSQDSDVRYRMTRTRRPPMPYYRSVGDVPRKRHTQYRAPRRRPVRRGADGHRGLLATTPRCSTTGTCPTAIVDAVGGRRTPTRRSRAEPSRCCRAHLPHARARDAGPADAVTGRRVLLGNGDVRISYVAADRAEPALPQRDRRRGALRRVRQPASSRPSFGALAVGEGDYVVLPTSTTTAGCPTRPGAAAAARDRGARATSARRGATSRRAASSSSTRRTASATSAGPRRAAPGRRRGRRRPGAARARASRRYTYAAPPVRRGRLGRLPLPVRRSHPRLRADHRAAAPAAAGAPDVRGARTSSSARSCRGCSTTTRCRSRRRTTTPTSTATR